MVQGALLFMNNFASQAGGGGSSTSNRVALAGACGDRVRCDVPGGVQGWGGALVELGTIGANTGTGAITYNAGGFAAGLDQTVAPGLRVGVTAGYTTGAPVDARLRRQRDDEHVLAGLYGDYRMDRLYVDAVLGYASYNQMWRQIVVPGVLSRTAKSRAGANQWYGQVEAGYPLRHQHAGRRLGHAVRALAGLHRQAGRLQRERCAIRST